MTMVAPHGYTELGVRVSSLFACLWFVCATIFLILGAHMYRGEAVDEACARYVAAAADRVNAHAASVLTAALAARDAVDYAVQRKFYFEPMDYATARSALEPVFAATAALRAVELAFTDRNDSITVQRLSRVSLADSPTGIVIQSSAADCFQLGPMGCSGSAPARAQRWYALGFEIPVKDGGFAEGETTASIDPFRWDDRPGFVPLRAVRSDGTHTLGSNFSFGWAPAYALIFRSLLPGTRGELSVIGRAVLEVSELRAGGQLMDITGLGAEGGTYICDLGGSVVGAQTLGTLAHVQESTGLARFRKIWELDRAWAKGLSSGDFGTSAGKEFETDGFHVAIAPLRGRGLRSFFVVAAGERRHFVDDNLAQSTVAGEVLVCVPYPAAAILFMAWYVHKLYKQKQKARRRQIAHQGRATLHDTPFDGGAALEMLRLRTGK